MILSLLARSVVDGFINGLHRSPYLGFSTDFAEHRSYMPGDDIRGIDWKLYARTDRFYIKQFEAETNSNFMVLLDVSASMGFKTGENVLVFGCSTLGRILCLLIAGVLTDRLGTKKVFFISHVGLCAVCFAVVGIGFLPAASAKALMPVAMMVSGAMLAMARDHIVDYDTTTALYPNTAD